MYFTNGSSRAFEMLMRGKPGFDRYENGGCADCEDCNTCHFYRPHWKYQFCVYAECPYEPGKLTALAAVKFTVKGADDDMAVFRVEKNKGYTVMSNHHLRNKVLSLKAKAVLAGGLGLHPKGPVPYQPGKHRRYQDGGVGVGTGRIYQAGAGP